MSTHPDLYERLSVEQLAQLQANADSAAIERAPDAEDCRRRALRARAINATQNWAMENQLATEREIRHQCGNFAIGYGVDADELYEVVMHVYRGSVRSHA